MTDSPTLRQAARAFLIDPDERVLLVRFEFPDLTVWCAPGGGLDPGETPRAAVVRELAEEVGLDLTGPGLGDCVGHRVHLFDGDGHDGQEEWYGCVRTPAFTPAGSLSAEELRAENVHEIRWWSLPDLRAAVAESAARSRPVTTGPRDLPDLLEAWLRDGVPTEPVELAV